MARTKKAATKTTAKTASVSETPAKSVVTASEEKAVQAETPKTDDAKASVETKKAAVYVQYWGKEIHTSEVADRIKKIWTDDMGKKATDLKDLKIYIKPEDNGAHYVINGDVTGFIGL